MAVTDCAIVGLQFHPSLYGPKWTQPGGIGTPVFPAQTTGELVGLFMAGCGHSFNSWIIEESQACNGDTVAVVMCPLCRYCQRIIDPFSDLYSLANEIVFA